MSSNQHSIQQLSVEELRTFLSRPSDLLQAYRADREKYRDLLSKQNKSEQDLQRLFHTKEKEKIRDIERKERNWAQLASEYQAFFCGLWETG